MKKQVKSWLDAAFEDLSVIEKIGNDELLTNMIAFHAQQSIEKTLKAILESLDEPVPKTHNLIVLREKAKNYQKFELDKDIIAQINELYIESRYPSDIGLLPEGKPSLEKAMEFYRLAFEFYTKIKNGLS